MTLREASDIVLGRIYGGFIPDDAKISERRAMVEILIQRDGFVQSELRKSDQLWDLSPEMFVIYGGSIDPVEDADQTKWITLSWNTFLNRYHLTLPTPPLALLNDRGIDMIYPVGYPQEAYIRISSDMETQVWEISQGMEGNVTWKLTTFGNNRVVEFPNMTPAKLPKDNRVVVKMIPTSQAAMFQTIGEGDRISLPGKYLDMILDKATAILLTLDNRQDAANDNLDKK